MYNGIYCLVFGVIFKEMSGSKKESEDQFESNTSILYRYSETVHTRILIFPSGDLDPMAIFQMN